VWTGLNVRILTVVLSAVETRRRGSGDACSDSFVTDSWNLIQRYRVKLETVVLSTVITLCHASSSVWRLKLSLGFPTDVVFTYTTQPTVTTAAATSMPLPPAETAKGTSGLTGWTTALTISNGFRGRCASRTSVSVKSPTHSAAAGLLIQPSVTAGARTQAFCDLSDSQTPFSAAYLICQNAAHGPAPVQKKRSETSPARSRTGNLTGSISIWNPRRTYIWTRYQW